MDAVATALSKHDQVLIPASTRLGRIQALVPTCMACDRPLTSKARKCAPEDTGKSVLGNPGENIDCRFTFNLMKYVY